MVNYVLMITAELENLTDLQPQGGCDDPNFTYYFKLKCGNCGELTSKEAWLSLNETVPLQGSRGTAHLVQKCKFCAREGNITMVTGKGRPLTQPDSESGNYAPVMQFDCRGFEPLDFVFGSGWQAESVQIILYHTRAVRRSSGSTAEKNVDEFRDAPSLIRLMYIRGKGSRVLFQTFADVHAHVIILRIEGTRFDAIDLSGGEFAEYDEKGEFPVMISNLRAMFSVVK